MYVTISHTAAGGTITYTDYTAIRNLSFAPQADLIAQSLPVNEFSCDIVTTDEINLGETAELYDDLDHLYASYWITYAERQDARTLRVTAKSLFTLMEQAGNLPAEMWTNKSAGDAILECVQAPGSRFGAANLSIDSSFDTATLTGFVPEQNARERLLWILYAIGGWAKTAFNNVVEILPIDSTETLIPLDVTFWKPQVNFLDWVTSLSIKSYSFAQGTPQTTDEYVTDKNGVTYIVTATEVTLANTSAPAAAPENVIELDDVYLVNSSNVSAILTRLSTRYFKRVEVEADVINNADYAPGDKVTVYADENTLYSGFIERADFGFGVQARSRLKLTACENKPVAKLTILCVYDGTQIGKSEYTLPVGYAYSIQMLFIDWTMGGHRFIFRPTQAAVTGTMTAQGAEVEVEYAVALDLYKGVLKIVSVDDVSTVTEDGIVIGVIG